MANYIEGCLQSCANWGLIPTEFRQCMTWEEQVLWLAKFLRDTVIPTVNQNTEQFKELEHWFDNLDVTEEVNAKLDEMAESGELAEIIGQYLEIKTLLAYDSVAEMAASDNLLEGSSAQTLGFHAYGDGGSKKYKIIKEESASGVDGRNKISLGHGDLYAVAINDEINVKQFGAKGDGIADDSTAIQYCIDTFPHHTIIIPEGDYKINSTLAIKAGNDYQVDLQIDKNARIFAGETLDALLTIGEEAGGAYTRYAAGSHVNISGGQFDGTNVNGQVIRLDSAQKETRLLFVTVRHVQAGSIGIQINGAGSSDSILQNVIIQGDGSEYNATGLELNSNDNKITGLYCQKLKRGVHINSGGNFLRNYHVLGSWEASTVTAEMYNDCVGIEADTQDQFFTDIYLDTMATGIKVKGSARLMIKGLAYYFWTTPTGAVTTLFNYTGTDCVIKVSGGWIAIPTNANGTNRGVIISGSADNENYFYYRKQLEIVNTHTQNLNALSNKADLLLDLDNDLNPINPTPWSVTMTNGAYYPIACVFGMMDLEIRMANDQIIRATVKATDSTALAVTNILNNAHTGEYKLAILDGITSPSGTICKYLAVRATSSNCSLNPSIKRLSGRWNDRLTTCPNFMTLTPIQNPTVLQESSFNPV